MRPWLLAAIITVLCVPGARADEPAPPAAGGDGCAALDKLVLRTRTHDRPMWLYSGDPQHGFHPACRVDWSTLSPENQPLPIIGCFRGSLLRVANDTACGSGTGPLWVSSRWVVTRRDLAPPPDKPVATCQQLDTSALAATRDFNPDCLPRAKEDGSRPAPGPSAPAAADKGARPAAAPSSTEPTAHTR